MTQIPPTDKAHLSRYLSEHQPRVLVLTHERPDPDAIGSAAALRLFLRAQGLTADAACLDPVPEDMQFLPGTEDFLTEFILTDYDAVWLIDCGDEHRTGFQRQHPQLLNPDQRVIINLDHHITNGRFGHINFVDPDASSACEILVALAQSLGWSLTPPIATLLLLGLYGDTGAFQHSNTTPAVLGLAARLIRAGANRQSLCEKIFLPQKFSTLKLWAKALENLHVTEDGAAIIGVEREVYEKLGVGSDAISGIVDYVNSMPEARYSVLLKEDDKGNVKASLRTSRDDVDVSALAAQYGGGGHVKAAGFRVPKSSLQKEIKWKIIPEAEEN